MTLGGTWMTLVTLERTWMTLLTPRYMNEYADTDGNGVDSGDNEGGNDDFGDTITCF